MPQRRLRSVTRASSSRESKKATQKEAPPKEHADEEESTAASDEEHHEDNDNDDDRSESEKSNQQVSKDIAMEEDVNDNEDDDNESEVGSEVSKARSSRTNKKEWTDQELSVCRDALFASVEEGDEEGESLVSLFSQHSMITVTDNLLQQKQLLKYACYSFVNNRPLAIRFFAGLRGLVETVAEQFDKAARDYCLDDTLAPPSMLSLQTLHCAAMCFTFYLHRLTDVYNEKQKIQSKPLPQLEVLDDAFQTAVSLHDCLFCLINVYEYKSKLNEDDQDKNSVLSALSTKAESLINCIWLFCELAWKRNIGNNGDLIAQTFTTLLHVALADHNNKKLVHRTFLLRDAVQIFDFSAPYNCVLRSTVLRCLSSPLFLKLPEGRRFLSCLFCVPSLMADLLSTIKAQLPDAVELQLDAYADILYRAWKEAPRNDETDRDEESLDSDATPSIQEQVMWNILCELFRDVIYVADESTIQGLRTLLEPFHARKHVPAVQDVLFQLYGPILWRALDNPNYLVKCHALFILSLVFPLHPSAVFVSNANKKKNMQQQQNIALAIAKGVQALKTALLDPYVEVRIAAVEATTAILAEFWDVLPTTDIQTILDIIVLQLASDATSGRVRVATLDAFRNLLEVEKTRAVLREVLPTMGNLFHDKVDDVRLAAVQLLEKVKSTVDIKYFHVVPGDHLEETLAEEGRRGRTTGPVASAVTKLILHSYIPMRLERAIKFWSKRPAAAAVFYSNVYQHVSINYVAQVVAELGSAVQLVAFNSQNDGGEETETTDLPDDPGVLANLWECIFILWKSIQNNLLLSKNEQCRVRLLAQFKPGLIGKTLVHYAIKTPEDNASANASEYSRLCAAILRVASLFPIESRDEFLFNSCKLLEAEAGKKRSLITAYIRLLFLWDKTEELSHAIAASINGVFDDDSQLILGSPVADSKKRKGGRRRKHTNQLATVDLSRLAMSPMDAIDLVSDLLSGSDPDSCLARDALLNSENASRALEQVLERGLSYAEHILAAAVMLFSLNDPEISVVLKICEAYGRVALHKEASFSVGITVGTMIYRIIQWTDDKVIPALFRSLSTESFVPFDANISRISTEKSFESSPLSPIQVGRPRRRTKTSTSSRSLQTRASSFGLPSEMAAKTTAVQCARGFALSILKCTCTLFSEWVAVGNTGSFDIAAAALAWCKQIAAASDNDAAQEAQRYLLPDLCRLANQLSQQPNANFTLLQCLIVSYNEDLHDVAGMAPLRNAVCSLIATRGSRATSMIQKTIRCIMEAAYELIDTKAVSLNVSMPSNIEAIWPAGKGSVRLSLDSLLSSNSKQVYVVLAKELVSSLPLHLETRSADIALFDLQCLNILYCDENVNSKAAVEIQQIILQHDLPKLFEKENPLYSLASRFVESIAVEIEDNGTMTGHVLS